MPPKPMTDLEWARRFWGRVDVRRDGECWPWIGTRLPAGYGSYTRHGRPIYAHRYSWEVYHGRPIPDGLTIDHLCRHPWCVNPKHLEAVTMAVNLARGDSLSAQRSRQTHCRRGHPLSGENLYQWRTRRYCLTCRRDYDRARSARKAA